MIAKGPALKLLVSEITREVAAHEVRKRTRKAIDQQNHFAAIDAVVSNLAYACLLPSETGRLAVDLSHGNAGRTRYDNPAFGEPYGTLLRMFEALGFLDIRQPPNIRGEKTSIAPSLRLVERVAALGITLSDFGRHPDDEVLLLSKTRRRPDGTKQKVPIDYRDTEKTLEMRAEVKALSAFLEASPIEFVDDGEWPPVDPHARSLRRHFVVPPGEEGVRFDRGGRLFGGFWQNVKSVRRRHIRIAGEETSTLDYRSMFTRLAYQRLGVKPPDGDLYAIPGLLDRRESVKRVMSVLLFDRAPTRPTWPVEVQELLPKGWGVREAKRAILEVHPELRNAWGRGWGYELMFAESTIMLEVLKQLASDHVAALTLHDGLIVPRSSARRTKELMRGIGRLPVETKD
jgi:hypothetical protein